VAHFRLCTAEAIQELRAIDAHIRRRLQAGEGEYSTAPVPEILFGQAPLLTKPTR
jgi:hypothetical protein